MLPNGHTARITRLSKITTALLITVFAVDYFIPATSGYLALVPGRTLPCVWNLVTAGFLTTNLFKLIIEIAALILLARLVEPVYGSLEFLKFLFIVDFATCISVFVLVYITYAATAWGDILYTQFYGFHGILAGLLVALRQVMQDQDVILFGSIKLGIKYIPTLVILLVTALAVGLKQYELLPFLYFGAYSAWIYLRFFQSQPETGTQGDASEGFKFSGCLPLVVAPIIDPIAAVFSIVFRLRHSAPAEGQGVNSKTQSMLGSDSADANRRRERGAKALEERLGMKKNPAEGDVEAAADGEPEK